MGDTSHLYIPTEEEQAQLEKAAREGGLLR
jgi:hypothetical protein